MFKVWKRFVRKETLLLSVLLVSTTLLIAYLGLLWRIDLSLYDAQLELWEHPAPRDIVIIAIDETTLDELGGWPLPDEHHATLLAQPALLRARAIFFNLPVTIDRDGYSSHGGRLRDELERYKKAGVEIYFSQQSQDMQQRLMPYSPTAGSGDIHIAQDADGMVRSIYLRGGLTPNQWRKLNPAVGDGFANLSPDAESRVEAARKLSIKNAYLNVTRRIYIPFAGPPGHFHRIPYHEVLNGAISGNVFRDKLVLIGITAPVAGHGYHIPTGGFAESVYDIELTGHVVDALRSGSYIIPVSLNWYLAYSGLFALLPFLLFPSISPRNSIIVTLLLATATVCISLLVIVLFHRWLPPAAALVAVILGYMLWSSRRLQNAVNYLGGELARLNAEMAGREVDLSTRLGSAFTFLENIMPITGWYISDPDGNVEFNNGRKPALSAALPAPGTWLHAGDQLWTSLVKNQRALEIGMRWATPDGPTTGEKTFLEDFFEQFTGITERTEQETVEVVENLITQVKEAIINLRTMHQFFDDCIAQMADGLLVTNDVGKVLFANNRAALYLQGHTINNPAGRDIARLLDNLTLDGEAKLKDLLREAYFERVPIRINARNEQGMDLLLQLTPLLRHKTGISGVTITISDISYLKSVERARNETISFVSHDLRSPLVSVLALLEMVKSTESPEELRKLHKRIEEYTHLTISMAEQFIQLTRIESNAEIKQEVVDLLSAAVNAHDQVWYQAQSKGINLVREFEIDHAWVRADAGLLERAIINLLNNAIKYSPEGSTVYLEVFSRNGNIRCCIEDQGYGIPEAELPSLFDRFHRVHLNNDVDEQGIGLGLALVKATMDRHGGSVEVSSSEGKGSSFCLVLPEVELGE